MTEYTFVDSEAGFEFSGSFPQVNDYIQRINSTTDFLPLQGGGLSALAKDSAFAPNFTHPTSNLFSFSPTGVDFTCISQLNTVVATSWQTDNWQGNKAPAKKRSATVKRVSSTQDTCGDQNGGKGSGLKCDPKSYAGGACCSAYGYCG